MQKETEQIKSSVGSFIPMVLQEGYTKVYP